MTNKEKELLKGGLKTALENFFKGLKEILEDEFDDFIEELIEYSESTEGGNSEESKEMKMTMSDNSEFSETLGITLNYLKELLEKKNRDYGSNNLLTFGDLGILVRLSDKLERLKNYVLRDQTFEIDDENLEDTLYDIAGYAIMWIVLRKVGYELEFLRNLMLSSTLR